MKHVLVTGGSGFFGCNIATTLKRKFSVFAPSHKELDLLDGVKVSSYITKHSINTVIHCATGERFGGFAESVRMFVYLLEQGDRLSKIITFGSGAEYDKRWDLIRVTESSFGQLLPADEYGMAKYLMSLLSKTRKNIITLRPFGVYGSHEDYCIKFISNAIVKQLSGIHIVIKQDVIFDYLYIDDLVKIIEHMLTHQMRHRVYNVTPDESIKLSDIVRIIQTLSGVKGSVMVRYPGLNFQYTGSNRQLRHELPRFRFHTYEEGIAKLYAYYKTHYRSLNIAQIKKDEFFKKSSVRI